MNFAISALYYILIVSFSSYTADNTILFILLALYSYNENFALYSYNENFDKGGGDVRLRTLYTDLVHGPRARTS